MDAGDLFERAKSGAEEVVHDSRGDRERLQSIDPYDFEQFVADLWSRQGWRTEVSPEGADRGVDIEAWRDEGLVEQKLAIQAKRYTPPNRVGRPEIQQYHALKQQDRHVDAVVVVTTGTFTEPAEEWAETHNIKLVDVDELLRLIEENECEDLVDQYAGPVTSSDSATQDAGSDSPDEEDLEFSEGMKRGFVVLMGAVIVASVLSSPADWIVALSGIGYFMYSASE